MYKTPGMAYITRKIKLTPHTEMKEFVLDSPLKNRDKVFMFDILDGLSYKELEIKYEKSEARIAQWKRSIFEQLHQYEYQIMRK